MTVAYPDGQECRGGCGRPTITGYCSTECRLSAEAVAAADELDLSYEPPKLSTWELRGEGGMTFPARELTAEDAVEWLYRKRRAYPTALLKLVLVE